MKYLAAYLLLTAGGKANPAAEDIKSLLSSVGVEAEDERISALIAALKDKDVNEVMTPWCLTCVFSFTYAFIGSR